MNNREDLWHVCVSKFFPLNIKLRSAQTRYQYQIAYRCYGRFLGHSPTLDDLTDDSITAWMSTMLDDGLSESTVKERAGRFQTLWTWLAKRGIVPNFPTFIKPEPPERLPYALSASQLDALFHSALKERGTIGTIPADLWWLSFLAFVWTTAERKTATLSVRPEWLLLDDPLNAKATIPASVRKGRKKTACHALWPETVPLLRAVLAIDKGREFVWPFPYCVGSFYTRYDRILRGAGIPVNRKTKTHSLRVSHATWLEVAGGDPTRQLMHSDRGTTWKSYIDPTKLPNQQARLFIPWLNQPPPSGPQLPPAA